jgi:acyl-CoA dehydrogenase
MTIHNSFELSDRAKPVFDIVAEHAESVDAQARFPHEAVAALKRHGLMSAMLPVTVGGGGASIREVAELCCQLGQRCGSTAMIYAMHNIKLSSLIMHGMDSPWHRDFMKKISRDQLLLGSATTEGGIGGDLRNSICAVEIEGGTMRLAKDATVISYGEQADAILITARSNPNAASSDQVLVAFERGQYTLEQTVGWNTLGMRGTCSLGYKFVGQGRPEQVLPKPFAEIAAQSMLAHTHTLWASLWYGIAANAVLRAQAFVRAAARRQPNVTPPGAVRLAEVTARLNTMKSMVADGIRQYEQATSAGNDAILNSMAFGVAMNNVKVCAAEMAVEIVNRVLLITGIAGYRNDTPYSIGRHLRDVLSAPIMINNDRIYGNTANLLLVHKNDNTLFGVS